MADAKQRIRFSRVPTLKWAGPVARLRNFCRLILFFSLGLGVPVEIGAADSYSTVVSKHLALESDAANQTEGSSDAEIEDPRIADLKRAVMAEAEALPRTPHVAPPTAPKDRNSMLMAVAVPLAALLGLGGIGYVAKRRLDSLASARALTEDRSAALVAEDPTVSGFFRELRHAMSTAADTTEGDLDGTPQPSEVVTEAAPDPLHEFFAEVPGQMASLRKLFSEIRRAADEAARQEVLHEFHNLISGLKEISRPPELRPFWLLACALEGLLNQLAKNPAEVTPSSLGTVAGAVDLLEKLCVRGVNPNLASEPPVKLLAVDDDPVSRLAVSFALKKAFNPPDLAPDGETALGLCARQDYYDVIFLDVDMPGMDGYELCTKIHQTAEHRNTPIVFVTRHGDFQSRAKSTLSGGEGLIAKPFLAFEITVKALTLALRGRLHGDAAEVHSAPKFASETVAVKSKPVSNPPEQKPHAQPAERNGKNGHSASEISFDTNARLAAIESAVESSINGKSPWELSDRAFQSLFNNRDHSPQAFFTHAPAYLEQLRAQLQATQQATEPADLQKLLGQLHLAVHSFHEEAELAELRTLTKLVSALEGLLNKLVEKPKLCTPSTFSAAAAALDLVEELCGHTRLDPELDLADPPPSILVVDDDPVARRGISMAIQLVFGRPDDAESGEAALALAAEKTFDLIFLDVLMPGIDGFTTCSKLHKTGPNRRTPVVFVTSHDDTEARSKAVLSGGCGFIPKPVLSSQIKLTALTHILRSRLKKSNAATSREEAVCLEVA